MKGRRAGARRRAGVGLVVLGLIAFMASAATAPSSGVPSDPRLCRGERLTAQGTGGEDIIFGTRGRDVIVGRGGDDLIRGRGGNDVICGGPGVDTLNGVHGADRLFGGKGVDYMWGGHERDWLDGQAGEDTMWGEEGRGDACLGGVPRADGAEGQEGASDAAALSCERIRNAFRAKYISGNE